MANTEKYQGNDGKDAWAARWRDGEGKQRKKRGFTSERKAQKYGNDQEAAVRRGEVVVVSTATVAEYARAWAASRSVRPNSARRIESTIKHHIEATPLGRRKVAAVQQIEVQTWLTDRAKNLAPRTLKNTVSLLRSVFTSAANNGLIIKSPVFDLTYPTVEREPQKFVPLTVSQVRSLADAMPGRYRAMVLVQAGLGLRIGELLALRYQDINFLHRQAKIDFQLSNEWSGEGRRGERIAAKTRTSHRTIPMSKAIADAITEHVETYGIGEDGSLWQTNRRKPPGHQHYGQHLFKAAVKAAGLPEETTSHDLRHHFASLMLDQGLTHAAVAELLGHKDATLVVQTYGHAMPDKDERARAAMDAAWSDAV